MSSEPAPRASDSPWTEEIKAAFESKSYSKHFDPCQDAANKSIKCMHRNIGNKDLCNDYFQLRIRLIELLSRAYRECKKAWMEAKQQMKRNEK